MKSVTLDIVKTGTGYSVIANYNNDTAIAIFKDEDDAESTYKLANTLNRLFDNDDDYIIDGGTSQNGDDVVFIKLDDEVSGIENVAYYANHSNAVEAIEFLEKYELLLATLAENTLAEKAVE